LFGYGCLAKPRLWWPDGLKPITVISCSTMVKATWIVSMISKPAIAIYEPELPLTAGLLPLTEGLTMPGCIRDAAPDAWGRRVIINKKLGLKGCSTDTAELDELTYLLESGSDRIGALDFQRSPTEYVPRTVNNVSMEELIASAERVEKGIPLTPELDQALVPWQLHRGARPKALIQEGGKKYVAKFSSKHRSCTAL
jgi:serine/threonine-protein kinase HipA